MKVHMLVLIIIINSSSCHNHSRLDVKWTTSAMFTSIQCLPTCQSISPQLIISQIYCLVSMLPSPAINFWPTTTIFVFKKKSELNVYISIYKCMCVWFWNSKFLYLFLIILAKLAVFVFLDYCTLIFVFLFMYFYI